MKSDSPTGQRIVIRLSKREAELFERVLGLYPVLTSADAKLTRHGGLPDQETSQELLEESLSEQRAETRKLVQEFLADSDRFTRTQHGVRLELTQGDAEWLLQVLNDVRVGSWVRLGCPEHKRTRLAISAGLLNLSNARQFWDMEVSGYFQMRLLEKLHPVE